MRMSDTMQQWLHQRSLLDDVDAGVARMILNGEVAPDAPDYLDLTSVDKIPRITYLSPEKIEQVPEAERFTKRGARIIGRPGSVIQKVVGQKLPGYAMDRLVQSAGVFLHPPDPAHFEILTGKDVWKVFDRRNTCHCNAYNMIRSCMTIDGDPKRARPQLAFYEQFCDIAVWTCGECGRYRGRTILWKATDGNTYHDRIYADDVASHSIGIMLMERGIHQLRTRYTEAGAQNITVAFAPEDFAKYDKIGYPYFDTMHYRCTTCCTLGNAQCPEAKGVLVGRNWNYGQSVSHGPSNPVIKLLWGTHDAKAAGSQEALR